jgi:oxygen-dependent protoporphyrinogen oxidase
MSHHIAILGAGISGLAIAWFLKQSLGSQIQLTILEKDSRAGGWIHSLQTNEFLFEQGPRSCRTKGTGRETLALIEALGLQNQIVTPHSDARNRYIYNGKNIQCLPKHLWEIPFNFFTRDWMKSIWRDWRMPKRQEEDESIHSFFSRRLGISWTENLIDPFVSGIYAGDCQRLSLKSCFPLFDQWEQQQGSLLRGAWRHRPSSIQQTPFLQKMSRFPMFSFSEGMEILPQALAYALRDCLSLEKRVIRLNWEEHKVKIQLDHEEPLVVDQVISTLPTFALSALLTDYPSLAAKLKALPYASVAVINVGYSQPVLPFKGFGYLIPSRFKKPVLGCVWDSSVFPQQNRENQTRLTVMMGGSHHPEVEQMSESELIEQSLRTLREHLNIRIQPKVVQVQRAQHAIPQFEVGHSMWKKEVQELVNSLFSPLILSGSAWTGVSINDCVAQAHQLERRISTTF